MACCKTEHVKKSLPCASPVFCRVGLISETAVDETEWRFAAEPGLSEDLLRSISAYATATPLERRCCFAIAASTSPADLEQFVLAFNEADSDRDGRICRNDLSNALERTKAWAYLPVNANTLFETVDLDLDGSIDFTEFCSACLFNRLAPLDCWLAEQVFVVIDRDRDGLVSAQDVHATLGFTPSGLPVNRRFDLKEWQRFVVRSGPPDASNGLLGNSFRDASSIGGSLDLAKTEISRSVGSKPVFPTIGDHALRKPFIMELLEDFFGKCSSPDDLKDPMFEFALEEPSLDIKAKRNSCPPIPVPSSLERADEEKTTGRTSLRSIRETPDEATLQTHAPGELSSVRRSSRCSSRRTSVASYQDLEEQGRSSAAYIASGAQR